MLAMLSVTHVAMMPATRAFLPESLTQFAIFATSPMAGVYSRSVLYLMESSASVSQGLPGPTYGIVWTGSVPLVSVHFVGSQLGYGLTMNTIATPSFFTGVS